MASVKKPRRSRRAPAARRATRAVRDDRGAVAERALLALAARLSADADPPRSLAGAIDELLAAYAAEGPLAAALLEARRQARGDKRAGLALAWAREQVRLAIEDVLARGAVAHPSLERDTLAWLVLAAAESVAHEPPGAAVDRAGALRALVGGPA